MEARRTRTPWEGGLVLRSESEREILEALGVEMIE